MHPPAPPDMGQLLAARVVDALMQLGPVLQFLFQAVQGRGVAWHREMDGVPRVLGPHHNNATRTIRIFRQQKVKEKIKINLM